MRRDTNQQRAQGNGPMAPFVDSSRATIDKKYVAWIDVMGSGSMMVRSLQNTLNFTLKLQSAAIEAAIPNVKLFPMNDGVFAVSGSLLSLRDFVVAVYERIQLANEAADGQMDKVFVARAAIAYGPVFDGSSLTSACSPVLSENRGHADRILIGPPVVNAFRSESSTGPFGIFVHESARLYGPEKWSGSLLRYWTRENFPAWLPNVKKQLTTYFDFVKEHPHELDYPSEALEKHRSLAREFFNEKTL